MSIIGQVSTIKPELGKETPKKKKTKQQNSGDREPEMRSSEELSASSMKKEREGDEGEDFY